MLELSPREQKVACKICIFECSLTDLYMLTGPETGADGLREKSEGRGNTEREAAG